jgi:hypothetical protein
VCCVSPILHSGFTKHSEGCVWLCNMALMLGSIGVMPGSLPAACWCAHSLRQGACQVKQHLCVVCMPCDGVCCRRGVQRQRLRPGAPQQPAATCPHPQQQQQRRTCLGMQQGPSLGVEGVGAAAALGRQQQQHWQQLACREPTAQALGVTSGRHATRLWSHMRSPHSCHRCVGGCGCRVSVAQQVQGI